MADDIIKHCPTCGSELPSYPFKIGDNVRNSASGKEGIVTHVGATIDVLFDGYSGSFDRAWLSAYRLEKIN